MQDRVAHLETLESPLHGQGAYQHLFEDVKLEQHDLDLTAMDTSARSLGFMQGDGLGSVASDAGLLSPISRQDGFSELSSPFTSTLYSGSNLHNRSHDYGPSWQDPYDVLSTDFILPSYGENHTLDMQNVNSYASNQYGQHSYRDPLTLGLDQFSLPCAPDLGAHSLHPVFTNDPFNFEALDQHISRNNNHIDSVYQDNGSGIIFSQAPSQLPQYHSHLDNSINEDHMFLQCLNDFSQMPLPQLPQLPLPPSNDYIHHNNMHEYLNLQDPDPTSRMDHENENGSAFQSPGPPNISKCNAQTQDHRKPGAKPVTLKELAQDDSRFAKVVMAFMSISDEKRRTVSEIAKQVSALFPEKYGDFEYVKVCLDHFNVELVLIATLSVWSMTFFRNTRPSGMLGGDRHTNST